jgi:hypothetical protein
MYREVPGSCRIRALQRRRYDLRTLQLVPMRKIPKRYSLLSHERLKGDCYIHVLNMLLHLSEAASTLLPLHSIVTLEECTHPHVITKQKS